MASKVIVSKDYFDNLLDKYNKLFAKCDKEKNLKRRAEMFLELDLLNDKIERAEAILNKHK